MKLTFREVRDFLILVGCQLRLLAEDLRVETGVVKVDLVVFVHVLGEVGLKGSHRMREPIAAELAQVEFLHQA